MELGSLADWTIVLLTFASFTLLYVTLNAQLITLKEQQKLTRIEIDRRSDELVPFFDIEVFEYVDMDGYLFMSVFIKNGRNPCKEVKVEIKISDIPADMEFSTGVLTKKDVPGNDALYGKYKSIKPYPLTEPDRIVDITYRVEASVHSTSTDVHGKTFVQLFQVYMFANSKGKKTYHNGNPVLFSQHGGY